MTLAWILLGLLATLLVAPFALGVPALKKNLRPVAEPKLVRVRIPEVDWADRGFFKRRDRDFRDAGFEPLGELAFEPVAGNSMLLAAYLSADRRVCGFAIQVVGERMQTLVLQFVSHFPDGTSVTTSNNRLAEVFLYPADHILFRHPRVHVLSSVLEQHLRNLGHYGSAGTAAPFIASDVVAWIESTARLERELQAAHGLEVRDGDFYRLTWKGAIRLAGRQWWHRVVGHWLD